MIIIGRPINGISIDDNEYAVFIEKASYITD